MSVWLHYWHERCIRAERNCVALATCLQRCDFLRHQAYSLEARKTIRQWAMYPPREYLASSDEIREWADRAGIAEGDSDKMAAALKLCTSCRNAAALKQYGVDEERRYGPLPAGPTLQGNLLSGGVTEF